MITKLHFMYIDANKKLISKISRRDAVFSFLPSSALWNVCRSAANTSLAGPYETRSILFGDGAYSSGVSRKEKEIETQRPLRLERVQRVGCEKLIIEHMWHNLKLIKWKTKNAPGQSDC
jgi:hypothetical protein